MSILNKWYELILNRNKILLNLQKGMELENFSCLLFCLAPAAATATDSTPIFSTSNSNYGPSTANDEHGTTARKHDSAATANGMHQPSTF